MSTTLKNVTQQCFINKWREIISNAWKQLSNIWYPLDKIIVYDAHSLHVSIIKLQVISKFNLSARLPRMKIFSFPKKKKDFCLLFDRNYCHSVLTIFVLSLGTCFFWQQVEWCNLVIRQVSFCLVSSDYCVTLFWGSINFLQYCFLKSLFTLNFSIIGKGHLKLY